jgi:tetratricopeptide (TPR) repeat protein
LSIDMGNKRHSNGQKFYSLCVVLSSFVSSTNDAFAISQSDAGLLGQIEKEVQAESISDRSYEEIQTLVDRYPNDDHIRLLLGDCLDSLGLPSQAMEQYETAVQLGPNDPKAVATLIKAKYKRGYLDEAEKLLDSARKRFPESSDLDFWSANFLFSKKNYDEAEKMYLKALQFGKPVPGLPTALANMKLMRKQYQTAVALADQDLEIDPKLFAALEIKGLALVKLGKFDQACPLLKQAFEAHRSNQELQVAYIQCLLWKSDYAEALRPALVHLSATASEYSDPVIAKKLVSSIIGHLTEQQINEAIAEVSKYPMYNMRSGYHFALGDLLDRRNYHALAVEQYREGLSLSPEFGRGWYRLGLDQETVLRDYDGALVSYKKAVQYCPRDSEVTNHFTRLQSRITTRKQDLAWLLKDKLKLNDLLRK